MTAFFRQLRWLIQRSRREAELREALGFHVEQEGEERQDDGPTEDEAR